MQLLWTGLAIVIGLPVVAILYLIVRGAFRKEDEEPAQHRMMRHRTESGHCCVCDYEVGSANTTVCPECGTYDPLWKKRGDPLWKNWTRKDADHETDQ